ncbi:hypothetical protein LRS03_02915 [Rhizobacter sp. J219]|uniref:hypothetical protein n=1 Tax=Rhizobacter sp. J219 TaxID=2898430 RepID=UPI0021518622|nr:hypothetical protein [Rhizobacter sp. J219]MCR5881863.1 hypothetical protein [Rhizobacter sp. J219]
MSHWIYATRRYYSCLPVWSFPFEAVPAQFVPNKAVLMLPGGHWVYAYQWCYLERRFDNHYLAFKPESLSAERVAVLPEVLAHLSRWLKFIGARPASMKSVFESLRSFINWADSTENDKRFECVFSDADLALSALKGHQSYLRQLVESNRLKLKTAAGKEGSVVTALSEIHCRQYRDEIEPLRSSHSGEGTRAPREDHVGQMMSTLQACFDSAARLLLRDEIDMPRRRVLQLSCNDVARKVELPLSYSEPRLMELACVVFAGLALGDSGSNLSQMQRYEEPDDLLEQLADPDRVNLVQKVIKFRAGGKPVPVFFTTTTISRLQTYLQIRERLVACLGGSDLPQLFIQCAYATSASSFAREPIAIRTLSSSFLTSLREKIGNLGEQLPPVTLMQLRTFKQQHIVRKHGVKVAADVLGHSIRTAVSAYCKAEQDVRRSDIGSFLSSLAKTVVDISSAPSGDRLTATPVGQCKRYGEPVAVDPQVGPKPDCAKTEGCFYCEQYQVHADAQDLRKLLSCRYVLRKLAPLQGESAFADRVYEGVINRIEALLEQLELRIPKIYAEVREDVNVNGVLSRFWAAKLQQLYLLGMLRPSQG